MSDDGLFKFDGDGRDAVSAAAEVGVDLQHIYEHLWGTAECNRMSLDSGFLVQFHDMDGREWTFSVIPEDGGKVREGLIQLALERGNE